MASMFKFFQTGCRFFLIILSLLGAKNCVASQLENTLDTIIAAAHSKATIGVMVQSMQTGKVLYQKNANELLIPASNLKLFTAYTALSQLGSDFHFQTEFLTDASSIKNGMIDGSLYAKFRGDPVLSLDDLSRMVAELSHQGVMQIRGNILVDNTLYDRRGISPGTVPEDQNYCYAAPVDALILNRNCLSVFLSPAKRIGQLAHLMFPHQVAIPIRNNVVTKNGRCHLKLTPLNNQEYELSGCVRPRNQKLGMSIALLDSREYGQNAMLALLQRYGIRFAGNVLPIHQETQRLHVLVSHDSKPLNELVFDMMKHSDNLIANSLYKQIGANYFNQAGSWENSGQAIYRILTQQHRMDLRKMVMIDGSGLSRYNLTTPAQFVQLLNVAYHDNRVAAPFITSLPVGGLNGTLRHRMLSSDMRGRVHAKTGTMKGVSALSGYIETTGHEILAFSIIVNNFKGSAGRFRILEDKICKALSVA